MEYIHNQHFYFGVCHIDYEAAIADEWCVDNEVIEGRNGCTSDKECLKNGRSVCDTDSNCFGISWYTHFAKQRLRICRSTVMETKTDGWRTMMKQGMYTMSIYQLISCLLYLIYNVFLYIVVI